MLELNTGQHKASLGVSKHLDMCEQSLKNENKLLVLAKRSWYYMEKYAHVETGAHTFGSLLILASKGIL